MKSILYIITGLGMGGAEHVVVALADKAASEGNVVKVAYLTGGMLVHPQNKNVEIIPIGMTGARSFFTALIRLRSVIKNFKPDVVHAHMFHANIMARFSRFWVKIPRLICSAHNSSEGGWLRMLLYRYTAYLGDYFTNVSAEAAAILETSGAAAAGTIIPVLNGIDTSRFRCMRKKNNKVPVLIAVGRLEVQKDYPNLLKAAAILKQRNVAFHLKIVGDGKLRSELSILSRQLSLDANVTWLGIQRNVPELLNLADLFVLSSAWEGFGLVVAEAMACELPVVATDCGGVREVVGDGRFLVPINSPELLANKIEEVLRLSASERMQIGHKNRERVLTCYSLEAMYHNYKKLYR
ncbi:MAG: glycosyltransferase [Thermomonas sp.]|uniref:glycosyltransferase n=1 Tax=Thermomonas sp. TaxID=1971895 RepID=UPI001EC038A7|nr:glycosyltransferase [Thermomonas sp.]MBV2209759.1 glycosyltransferase [Thermomonas sp.]